MNIILKISEIQRNKQNDFADDAVMHATSLGQQNNC